MKKKLLYSFVFTTLFTVAFFLHTSAQFDFALKNIDGKTISLQDYPEAKGFIIVFTCNHCPFAKLYPKRLNQLNKKYKALGVPLIAISSTDTIMYAEDTFDNMLKKSKEGKYNFPYLYDGDQQIARNYDARKTPQVFVLWKVNNEYVLKYNGAIDDNGSEPKEVKENYVANAVDQLLNDKEVTVPITNSIGCKINFRKN